MTQTNQEARVARLIDLYGGGADGASPTEAQWRALFARPFDQPITLVNCFALRDSADYGDAEGPASGREAFDRYAAVSVPTLAKVGGRFLHVGPSAGTLVGEGEPWDLLAIGQYPNLEALLALYEDEAYRAAYRHRVAACARQQVLLSAPMPG